jgi:HD-GYP domain-containing protein (c-di-GMP phosphodiesterase class II)
MGCEMNNTVLIDIIREYAWTIDGALLPETTISSLGLKLALRIKPEFDEIMKKHEALPRENQFALALTEIMGTELDMRIIAKPDKEHRILIDVASCKFRGIRSSSLCTAVNGIMGGMAFMAFGYSKLTMVYSPDKSSRPCKMYIYTAQTEEAAERPGIEFLKENIVLLKEGHGLSNDAHKRELRKTLLGLFNNLGLSLAKRSSDQEHAEDFIKALSSFAEVGLAALYLVERRSDKLILSANYGLREDMIPLVREAGYDIDHIAHSDEKIIKHFESTDWNTLATGRTNSRAILPILLKCEDRVIGVLVIGLSPALAMNSDFNESVKAVSSLLAASIDNSRLNFELEKSYMDMISMVNSFVTIVDRYLKQHSVHVAELAEEIGLQMGLPQEEATLLYQAGFVHDIGKISIPPDVLNKEGKLTDKEYKMVKEHPAAGVRLLAPAKLYKILLPAIKHHHERLDGTGYPDGLKSKAIPQHARIIAVADVFDAMMAQRAHREAHGLDEVLDELKNGKGIKYDSDVVDALLALVSEHRLPACITRHDIEAA